MASIEQCKAKLLEILKPGQDVIDFTDEWGGNYLRTPVPRSEFIAKNIGCFVDDACRKSKLDPLGLRIGMPSGAEAILINVGRANRRSCIAFGISIAALVVSILPYFAEHDRLIMKNG